MSKSFPAFQYSSHVSLQAQSGHMWLVSQLMSHLLSITNIISFINFYMQLNMDTGERLKWRERMAIHLTVASLLLLLRVNMILRAVLRMQIHEHILLAFNCFNEFRCN